MFGGEISSTASPGSSRVIGEGAKKAADAGCICSRMKSRTGFFCGGGAPALVVDDETSGGADEDENSRGSTAPTDRISRPRLQRNPREIPTPSTIRRRRLRRVHQNVA